jgi:hypothetical protein
MRLTGSMLLLGKSRKTRPAARCRNAECCRPRAAADEVIERGKRFAAHFMEADAADIAFADGTFTIPGNDVGPGGRAPSDEPAGSDRQGVQDRIVAVDSQIDRMPVSPRLQ